MLLLLHFSTLMFYLIPYPDILLSWQICEGVWCGLTCPFLCAICMDFSKVCHANLQGNLEAASDTLKNAIDMAEKMQKLHSLPSLFIHYSRLKYMVRNPGVPESAASEAN